MPATVDRIAARAPQFGNQVQLLPLTAGLAAVTAGAWQLAQSGPRPVLSWLIGVVLGLTLYHAAFGFASGYRRMFVARDMAGVQAQLLLLALTTVALAPALAAGSVFDLGLGGAWAPLGVSVAVGAFLFGIGMQLAGGCGSGTLYTAGGGSSRMMVVLGAACAGSFWASLHMGWWQALPTRDAIVLGDLFGWPLAVLVQLGVIATLALLLRHLGRPAPAAPPMRTGWRAIWAGPWPIAAAALLLALGNLGTLLVVGHPWSVTWGFTLWGAKAATLAGWQPEPTGFWQAGWQRQVLDGGLLEDATSRMDLALMLGALCAAALAGRYSPRWHSTWRSSLAAVIGGLAIGYGARIAYGCNIGAFVSGVASGSLHGWLWIAAALPGSWIGVRLRPLFGLAN